MIPNASLSQRQHEIDFFFLLLLVVLVLVLVLVFSFPPFPEEEVGFDLFDFGAGLELLALVRNGGMAKPPIPPALLPPTPPFAMEDLPIPLDPEPEEEEDDWVFDVVDDE